MTEIKRSIVEKMAKEGKYDKEIAALFGVSPWSMMHYREMHGIPSGRQQAKDRNIKTCREMAAQGYTSTEIAYKTGIPYGSVERYRIGANKPDRDAAPKKPEVRRIDA